MNKANNYFDFYGMSFTIDEIIFKLNYVLVSTFGAILHAMGSYISGS